MSINILGPGPCRAPRAVLPGSGRVLPAGLPAPAGYFRPADFTIFWRKDRPLWNSQRFLMKIDSSRHQKRVDLNRSTLFFGGSPPVPLIFARTGSRGRPPSVLLVVSSIAKHPFWQPLAHLLLPLGAFSLHFAPPDTFSVRSGVLLVHFGSPFGPSWVQMVSKMQPKPPKWYQKAPKSSSRAKSMSEKYLHI